MALVRAAAVIVPMLFVRLLRQAAGQRAAAAVAERAGQRAIAEGDDAALEHADGAVVSPTLAESEADADAEILDESVQFLAGRRIATDRFSSSAAPMAAIEQSATEWIMALWKSPGQPWATRISIAN
jgi:hypothetical protein